MPLNNIELNSKINMKMDLTNVQHYFNKKGYVVQDYIKDDNLPVATFIIKKPGEYKPAFLLRSNGLEWFLVDLFQMPIQGPELEETEGAFYESELDQILEANKYKYRILFNSILDMFLKDSDLLISTTTIHKKRHIILYVDRFHRFTKSVDVIPYDVAFIYYALLYIVRNYDRGFITSSRSELSVHYADSEKDAEDLKYYSIKCKLPYDRKSYFNAINELKCWAVLNQITLNN